MAKLNGTSTLASAGACVLLLAAVGCGRSDEATVLTENRLRVISIAYLDFAAARGHGPANEAELRKHLANSLAAKITLQKLGIENVPSLFVSERDGAPFVVRYGVPIQVQQSADAAPIALEATGRDGAQYVAFANGKVECVETQSLAPLLQTVAANK